MRCTACGRENELVFELATPNLTLFRCSHCGHREAQFQSPSSQSVNDYHESYSEEFLQSLSQVRMKQANKITDGLDRLSHQWNSVLDFGCGRGFFLKKCRSLGKRVFGVDTSPLAIEQLRRDGISMMSPDEFNQSRESFSVISFLDVIEHFERNSAFETIQKAFSFSPNAIGVIKVPVSQGLMFRLSIGLAKLGICGPLEQLFQVGTTPPHFHYFSLGSIQLYLQRLGFQVIQSEGESELDPDTWQQRVGFLKNCPKAVAQILGRLLLFGIRWTGWYDSGIYWIKLTRAGIDPTKPR